MLLDLLEKSIVPIGITHIAGPPNSGKTTMLYQTCKGLKKENKALILDCEINFSAQRLREILIDSGVKLDNITIISLLNKKQQIRTVMKIQNFLGKTDYKFVAINGITDHFRLGRTEKGEKESPKSLNLQLAFLRMISREYNVPIIFTNQVTPFKDGKKQSFRPVAGSAIKNYIDREVSLIHINRKLWKATHENEEEYYTISAKGIEIIKN
ncbi:MAG: hypothetical protein GOP50_07895 [Candidatus Heimdallarchaeota archaeon]|nr:hypothetical protein [Candidatus Heimdallarchaeota archaeon]